MDGESHFLGSILFYVIFWLFVGAQNIAFLLIGVLISILGGVTPDVLEPPTWPGHRGILHWLGIITIFIAIAFSPPQDLFSLAISAFCVGYFSHFVLDYLT